MILPLLLALQVAPADTLPQVTLAEALTEATRFDPNYVQAAGFVAEATWVRRAAMLVFVLPSFTASTDFTGSTTPSFNFGTNSLSNTIVTARLDARYELFTGGWKIADYQRATAELQGAVANEVGAGFLAAAQTEATFYDVLARKGLVAVAQRRLERAESQLADLAGAGALRCRRPDRLAPGPAGIDPCQGGPPPGGGGARRGARRTGPPGRPVGGGGRGRGRHDDGAGAPDHARAGGPDRALAGARNPRGRSAGPCGRRHGARPEGVLPALGHAVGHRRRV